MEIDEHVEEQEAEDDIESVEDQRKLRIQITIRTYTAATGLIIALLNIFISAFTDAY